MSMRSAIIVGVGCLGLVLGGVGTGNAAGKNAVIPMECDHGESAQKEKVIISVPDTAAPASVIHVRIDGTDSGKISHTGLNYIYDMTYEWMVPPGSQVVAGSYRVIPDTGTPNVRAGARVTHKNGMVVLVLPARVEDGGHYSPPSFEFDLKVEAAAGSSIVQKFRAYKVTANAFLVGDVHTTCNAKPKPYPVATTKIEAPAG